MLHVVAAEAPVREADVIRLPRLEENRVVMRLAIDRREYDKVVTGLQVRLGDLPLRLRQATRVEPASAGRQVERHRHERRAVRRVLVAALGIPVEGGGSP